MTRTGSILPFRSVVCVLAVIPLAVVMTGCGGSDDNSNNNGTSTAQVRLLNAYVPAAGTNGTLTVSNNGTVLSGTNGLQFGQFVPTTGFTTVNSGTFTPSATGAGITTPLTSTNAITLNPNTQTTLVAVGQAGTVGTTVPQLITIPGFDSSVTTIPSGQAAIRFVDLSPGAGTMTLFNSVNGVAATAVGGTTLNTNFGFNSVSNAYTFVPAGTGNTFNVSSSSTTNTPITLSGTNLSNLNLAAGQAYTIYTFGQPGSVTQPFNAVVTTDFPTT